MSKKWVPLSQASPDALAAVGLTADFKLGPNPAKSQQDRQEFRDREEEFEVISRLGIIPKRSKPKGKNSDLDRMIREALR
jgi:hypothetical protein